MKTKNKNIMPADMTMCVNDDCPIKEQCYRHTAKPDDPYQWYALFEPVTKDGQTECKYFLENKNHNGETLPDK